MIDPISLPDVLAGGFEAMRSLLIAFAAIASLAVIAHIAHLIVKFAVTRTPIEDHMDIDIQPDEKPKRFSGIGPDGELLTPIEDEFVPAEKPKRGTSQQPRYWLWVLGGFATGLILMVLAFNLIPGLRPADQHVYPADDRPHVVATPATTPVLTPDQQPSFSDWASTLLDPLFVIFAAFATIGFGISLFRYLSHSIGNTLN